MSQRVLLSLTLTLAVAQLAFAPRRATASDAAAHGPASPTDFDFLEGRWTVVYNNSQPGIPPDVPGTWVARKEADGRVLYDEFRLFGPNHETVFLGTTYRVFDHVENAWDMRYVSLGLIGDDGVVRHHARWAELRAWRDGARMRVDQRGDGAWLRITYYDITKDRFRWVADLSLDGGTTWNERQIRIEATRVSEDDLLLRLGALATAIQAADYEGDRAELSRLAEALAEVTDPRLQADCSYWGGFALWRRALNGFNLTPAPADLAADLEEAVRRFRSALAERPEWLEAKIGIVGAQSNLLFLARHDGEATRRILEEYRPVVREVLVQGVENPRALWLKGGIELGAPPPYGGDAAKAAATLARGLEAARREARESVRPPAYAPSWGAAENLMSLAYLHSHSALQDPERALAYARGALALVPRWHYVSEVLMPQIEALRTQGMPRDGNAGELEGAQLSPKAEVRHWP